MDLAARSAVVQPALDGDLFALVLADVFDVDVHTVNRQAIARALGRHQSSASSRSIRCRACRARASVSFGEPCAGDLEHQRAVVADLLHRRQRRRPVDRAVERHADDRRRGRGCRARASSMRCSDTVSIASTTSPSRCAWPKSRQMPTSGLVEIVFDEVHERAGARQLVRNHLDARAARRAAAAVARSASMLRRAGVAAVRRRRRGLRRGSPRCTTSTVDRNPPRDVQRALGFGDARARARPRRRSRAISGPPQRPPSNALADRRVDAVQLEPGFGQPLLQVRDRRRVVVVEVRARREHLDRLEAVRRDLEQMIAAQPLAVVEVRRHPELALRATRPNHSS